MNKIKREKEKKNSSMRSEIFSTAWLHFVFIIQHNSAKPLKASLLNFKHEWTDRGFGEDRVAAVNYAHERGVHNEVTV